MPERSVPDTLVRMISGMTASPALRADARRNHDALLAAARAVFAESGADAPLAEIARRAGVGQGTLYRRFPTRDDLVDAVLDGYLAEVRALAGDLGDADDALFALLRRAALLHRENRMLIDALGQRVSARGRAKARATVVELFEEPLRRAQAAGLARRELTPADVRVLLRMIGGTSARWGARDETERALELARAAVTTAPPAG